MCDDYIAVRASRGLRSLGVARSLDDGQTWQLVGLISLLDPPRPDSAETIRRAQVGARLGTCLGGGCMCSDAFRCMHSSPRACLECFAPRCFPALEGTGGVGRLPFYSHFLPKRKWSLGDE